MSTSTAPYTHFAINMIFILPFSNIAQYIRVAKKLIIHFNECGHIGNGHP
jgi:hypothetical protein